jgi:hypothetical protein
MGEKSYSIFEWWNHWPVAQVRSSGISAVAPDRPSHSSLSHIEGQPYAQTADSITKIMLDGLTDKPAAELALLARSWTSPPKILVYAGSFEGKGYDPGQRAFLFDRKETDREKSLRLTLVANEESPLVNPAFVVNGWGNGIPRLKIDGKLEPWGANARYGIVDCLDGGRLVVWLLLSANSTTTLEIDSN